MFGLYVSAALAFHAPNGAEVVVAEVPPPVAPRATIGRCEVMLVADATGVPTPMTTFQGYRDECDPGVSAAALAAASRWRFAENQPEASRSLWVTFLTGTDGVTRAVLSGKTADPLPPGVVLASPPAGVPKVEVPASMAEELGDVVCLFALDVAADGSVRSEAEAGCALDYRERIAKSLDQNQLTPRRVGDQSLNGKLLTWIRLPHGEGAGPAEVRTQPYAPGAEPTFHLVNGVGVRAFRLPELPARPPSFSICQVDWDIHGGLATPALADCEPSLAEPVLAAAKQWRFGDPDGASAKASAIFGAFPDGRTVVGVQARAGYVLDDPLPNGLTQLELPVIIRGSDLTWPKAAVSAPEDGVSCTYRLAVSPDGGVADVDVSACPAAYLENNPSLMRRWRLSPAKIEGRHIPSSFYLNLVYRPPKGTERPVESASASKAKTVPVESALFRFPRADVGVTFAVLPTLASPPAVAQYCEVAIEIGRNVAPQGRWCEGEFRKQAEAAAAGWQFVTAEPGQKSKSIGFYAFPDGRVAGVIWGKSPDARPVPPGIVYGEPPRPKKARPPGFPKGVVGAVDITCRTRVLVGANGRVREVTRPECPDPYAALVARRVRGWTFTPARVDETPVMAEYDLRTTFRR